MIRFIRENYVPITQIMIFLLVMGSFFYIVFIHPFGSTVTRTNRIVIEQKHDHTKCCCDEIIDQPKEIYSVDRDRGLIMSRKLSIDPCTEERKDNIQAYGER